MLHAHSVDTLRKTQDFDLGVMVRDWGTSDALRHALIEGGEFETVSNDASHKLRHKKSRYPLVIVPFGGSNGLTAPWPARQMNTLYVTALPC